MADPEVVQQRVSAATAADELAEAELAAQLGTLSSPAPALPAEEEIIGFGVAAMPPLPDEEDNDNTVNLLESSYEFEYDSQKQTPQVSPIIRDHDLMLQPEEDRMIEPSGAAWEDEIYEAQELSDEGATNTKRVTGLATKGDEQASTTPGRGTTRASRAAGGASRRSQNNFAAGANNEISTRSSKNSGRRSTKTRLKSYYSAGTAATASERDSTESGIVMLQPERASTAIAEVLHSSDAESDTVQRMTVTQGKVVRIAEAYAPSELSSSPARSSNAGERLPVPQWSPQVVEDDQQEPAEVVSPPSRRFSSRKETSVAVPLPLPAPVPDYRAYEKARKSSYSYQVASRMSAEEKVSVRLDREEPMFQQVPDVQTAHTLADRVSRLSQKVLSPVEKKVQRQLKSTYEETVKAEKAVRKSEELRKSEMDQHYRDYDSHVSVYDDRVSVVGVFPAGKDNFTRESISHQNQNATSSSCCDMLASCIGGNADHLAARHSLGGAKPKRRVYVDLLGNESKKEPGTSDVWMDLTMLQQDTGTFASEVHDLDEQAKLRKEQKLKAGKVKRLEYERRVDETDMMQQKAIQSLTGITDTSSQEDAMHALMTIATKTKGLLQKQSTHHYEGFDYFFRLDPPVLRYFHVSRKRDEWVLDWYRDRNAAEAERAEVSATLTDDRGTLPFAMMKRIRKGVADYPNQLLIVYQRHTRDGAIEAEQQMELYARTAKDAAVWHKAMKIFLQASQQEAYRKSDEYAEMLERERREILQRDVAINRKTDEQQHELEAMLQERKGNPQPSKTNTGSTGRRGTSYGQVRQVSSSATASAAAVRKSRGSKEDDVADGLTFGKVMKGVTANAPPGPNSKPPVVRPDEESPADGGTSDDVAVT
ncbi:unnamed protein product [Amoebophrya sp. A120]|nr:unnamed protein product [Amoebophrya sp. A120]|eukprot:GSA120T00002734001.1